MGWRWGTEHEPVTASARSGAGCDVARNGRALRKWAAFAASGRCPAGQAWAAVRTTRRVIRIPEAGSCVP
jgi:hypothetical protein